MREQQQNLLTHARAKLRLQRYAKNTEEAYIYWITKYIKFHRFKNPSESREKEIESFLTDLVISKNISTSTQSQALAAILYLYKEVLEIPLSERINCIRPQREKRLPIVLSRQEIALLFNQIQGSRLFMIRLLYGTGMRLNEFLNLRIKDIDFSLDRINIIAAKGGKDRYTLLPFSMKQEIALHIDKIKLIHENDLISGYGDAFLPGRLGKKYKAMGKSFSWQFVFPASTIFHDKTTGNSGRWHLGEELIAKIIRSAAKKAGIRKHVTSHTLRHSFATHLLESGVNLRIIQELLGHKSPETTMIYTHVMANSLSGTVSPVDTLPLMALAQ